MKEKLICGSLLVAGVLMLILTFTLGFLKIHPRSVTVKNLKSGVVEKKSVCYRKVSPGILVDSYRTRCRTVIRWDEKASSEEVIMTTFPLIRGERVRLYEVVTHYYLHYFLPSNKRYEYQISGMNIAVVGNN